MAATTISRIGYGQVEPNHLSAQRTGQIYAQLPADAALTQLENGQWVKYDAVAGKVNLSGPGEWMLVYNEEKLYKVGEHHKDFVMLKTDYIGNTMVPRVFKTNIGDIYTTNCVGAANTGANATYAGIDLEAGEYVTPNASGFLVKDASGLESTAPMLWRVVKVTKMPDDIAVGVKLIRVR